MFLVLPNKFFLDHPKRDSFISPTSEATRSRTRRKKQGMRGLTRPLDILTEGRSQTAVRLRIVIVVVQTEQEAKEEEEKKQSSSRSGLSNR